MSRKTPETPFLPIIRSIWILSLAWLLTACNDQPVPSTADASGSGIVAPTASTVLYDAVGCYSPSSKPEDLPEYTVPQIDSEKMHRFASRFPLADGISELHAGVSYNDLELPIGHTRAYHIMQNGDVKISPTSTDAREGIIVLARKVPLKGSQIGYQPVPGYELSFTVEEGDLILVSGFYCDQGVTYTISLTSNEQ